MHVYKYSRDDVVSIVCLVSSKFPLKLSLPSFNKRFFICASLQPRVSCILKDISEGITEMSKLEETKGVAINKALISQTNVKSIAPPNP